MSSMFKTRQTEIDFGGRPLVLETGRIARQADGAVLASHGGTMVLCAAVGVDTPAPFQDFFPLTVHYQEKAFAAGKIPGGFFKREGRPSEREILASRLIDRSIRPLFPKSYLNETQVVCTVLSHDMENDPSIVAIIGASAALAVSGLPFLGPVGAARVGYIDGEYILNPTCDQMSRSSLDLVVAAAHDGVLMVESEAQELSEEVMLGAVSVGHEACRDVTGAIGELASASGAKAQAPAPSVPHDAPVSVEHWRSMVAKAYEIPSKEERRAAVSEIWREVATSVADEGQVHLAKQAFKALEADVVRSNTLKTAIRIDGRDTKTIRDIESTVGVLPRAHGSALFTRGETQALVVATLGTNQDEQIVDALEGEYRERFLLHYNFPPYSVGETGRLMGPGRREIGHGKLAWRALRPLLPSPEQFPYSFRVVSEITESNGSSSMATVCGASLALMDAGVPLKRSVAGIAMGLIKEGDNFVVLSDILGDEDHLGDMDFKVAGTEEGITALQMDIKVTSVTSAIMDIALEQAREGRLGILDEMTKALGTARAGVSAHAPKITTMTINPSKIRDVIGSGGKVIREITDGTGAKIDIEDDGTIKIASADSDSSTRAVDWIKSIVAEPEVGTIYSGKVVKVMDYGAFVNFLGKRDGLVHVSEITNVRGARTFDHVQLGQELWVKCIGFDDRGKTKLSMKQVDQKTGQAKAS